ncbi:S8 family serine peptidase, partial [Anaerosolibacter sp.]|uniref:S8 family serine peptidase n=1 Tax=Anaerosolibacter sp. TaxID=1872527 RepID=UPI0039EEA90D
MVLKSKKFIVMTLVFTLILTQVLGMINVSAMERNNSSSKVVPGKMIVKYKLTESSDSTIKRFAAKSSDSKSSPKAKIIELDKSADVFQAVKKMKEDPNVEYAEPVYVRNLISTSGGTQTQSTANPDDEYYQWGEQWLLDEISLPYAWDKVSVDQRNNVTIAIIDTGIDANHPELADRIVGGYDTYDNDAIPQDIDGHGTLVAGVAAAISDNGIGIAGAAGGVKIMPLKVFGVDSTTGDVFATSQAIGDAIIWAADHGADVINLSLGGADYSEYEADAVDYALEQGVVVVAATGNESNHWIEDELGDLDYASGQERYASPVSYPAAYPGVIGVGAVDHRSDQFIIADFSNTGNKVDVVAPGVAIFGPVAGTTNDYDAVDGTSFSSPLVAGLAALLLAADQSLSPEQVQDIIVQSAVDLTEPLGDLDWDEFYGFGVIDGLRAFSLPRLNMTLIANDLFDAGEEVGVELITADYSGSVLSDVYGQALLSVEKYDFTQDSWISEENLDTVIEVVYGEGAGVLALPESGFYRIHADEYSDNEWVWSQSEYVVRLPEAPVANIASGNYVGSQSITLSSATEGATIYYTLDGTDPLPTSSTYTGAITLSGTTTLKALAYKAGLISDISTYTYTITASTDSTDGTDTGGSSGGTGGGGGGGGGSATPSTSTPAASAGANGEVKLEIPKDKLKDMETLKDTTVVVDFTSEKSDSKNFLVGFDAATLVRASSNNNIVTLKANGVSFSIMPNMLDLNDATTVKLATARLDDSEATKVLNNKNVFASTLSNVFDFSLFVNDKQVKKFKAPIIITLNFDESKLK